jgi:hypothetical protein
MHLFGDNRHRVLLCCCSKVVRRGSLTPRRTGELLRPFESPIASLPRFAQLLLRLPTVTHSWGPIMILLLSLVFQFSCS